MSSPGDGTDDRGGDRRDEPPADHDDENQPPRVEPATGEETTPGSGEQTTEDRESWRSAESADPPREREADTGEDRSEWELFAYDLVSSLLAVMVVGGYLFTVSGVWPPLVAVESESMVPNMKVNDLVFVMEEERFSGEDAHEETGVVTAHKAEDGDYRKFGGPGDVIVFAPDGNERVTPIIHRAMFYVDDGENWYDRADEDYVGGAEACETDENPETDTGLKNCPAPHAGFITKGDNNALYDQAGLGGAQTGPVKSEWVVGTAEFRIPGLGWVRLASQ